MRHHIAAHITGGKGISADQFPCGACGAVGLQCMPGLKKVKKLFIPDVVCSNGYYVQYRHASALKADNGSGCSNTPMECSACPLLFWKYSMPAHYAAAHAGTAVPADAFVGENEKKKMCSLARKIRMPEL